MLLLKKTFLFLPAAITSLVVTFLPISKEIWIKPALIMAVICWGFFQRELYLEDGKLRKRKRLELAFCSVLFLLSLNEVSATFQFWPFLPAFLFFVWLGFSVLELSFLTVAFAAFSHFWFHVSPGAQQYLMLVLGVSCAVLFRQSERQKKNQLQKRLEAFETFEKKISSGAMGLEQMGQLQARKESKIGELIQQREKRFDQFVALIASVFDPHSVMIYAFDPLKEEFNLQAFQSTTQDIEVERTQKLEGIFKAVESQKKSILFQSKNEITHFSYYKDSPRLVSVLATPIYHQSLLVGLIVVDSDRKAFVKGHAEVLEKIAISIAEFIQDAETIYSYFRLKEELASFYAASSMLNQAFHLQNVFDVFLKTSHEIVSFDLAFLVMTDHGSKTNRIVAQYGEFDSWIGETFSLSPSKGLISWVVENHKPLFYDGYRQRYEHSPLFHKKMKLPNIFQSVCIFPFETKEEVLGSVVFLSQKDKCFSASARKILEVLSMQASISIKNAKMVRDLEQLATTDGLTGLINHRTFQKQLIHEIERAKRTHTEMTLMLVDLDHFKKINDNYGHPIGDFVLKEVAAFLKNSVRNVDYVARYGGEEFAVILPDTTAQEALMMANRMAAEIRKKELVEQGLSLKVTFSIGIATYPEHAVLKEHLIDFADTALYTSKRTGRNKATLFTKSLKSVDFEEKEHILIQKAESLLQEQ
ncbi:MAG: diguanylate cyclase [Proteobacteria bacterium]|nr:diguanylate cyclase [Pseudomonadota bacterium]